MATGLVTLGTAAVGAAGDAASNPGAPAMTAPQNQEVQVTFGGAGARREAPSTSTAIIIGIAILGVGIIYVANSK